jgi:hypothetical protein
MRQAATSGRSAFGLGMADTALTEIATKGTGVTGFWHRWEPPLDGCGAQAAPCS